MSSFFFDSYWAFLLLPLLIALLFFRLWSRRRQTPTLQYSSLSLLKGLTGSLRSRFSYLPLVLKTVGLIFCVIALARPQKSDEKIKRNVEGIDIIF